jgi:hypothetical protein
MYLRNPSRFGKNWALSQSVWTTITCLCSETKVEVEMKRVLTIVEIAALFCFVTLLSEGQRIQSEHPTMYHMMFAVLLGGLAIHTARSHRARNRALVDGAIARYKKEREISD